MRLGAFREEKKKSNNNHDAADNPSNPQSRKKRSELGRKQKTGMQRRRQYMKACLEGRNLKGDLQDNIELTSLCSSGRHVRRKAAPSKSAISFILDSRLKENQKSLEDPALTKKRS